MFPTSQIKPAPHFTDFTEEEVHDALVATRTETVACWEKSVERSNITTLELAHSIWKWWMKARYISVPIPDWPGEYDSLFKGFEDEPEHVHDALNILVMDFFSTYTGDDRVKGLTAVLHGDEREAKHRIERWKRYQEATSWLSGHT